MMDIAKIVAKGRIIYHANACSWVNALWQLKLISGEKADELNKHHAHEVFDAVYCLNPKGFEKYFKKEEES